jgi:hypothetical protein
MDARSWIGAWPVYRQVAERDWLGPQRQRLREQDEQDEPAPAS